LGRHYLRIKGTSYVSISLPPALNVDVVTGTVAVIFHT
jgi:hypothetical protein